MATQTIFKRYELKYMLTLEQKKRLCEIMANYMIPDEKGSTTIRNIYFDTDSYLLIRRSIEKPCYKEKLRVRSYTRTKDDENVFVELKKKYKSVVYKRRIKLKQKDALDWLNQSKSCTLSNQISSEIDYFLEYYKTLHPAVFISYEREAFFGLNDGDFRITFDKNILFRQENFSLDSEIYGTGILPDDRVLMEIKCAGGIPLWLTDFLSKEHIYKTSFSKYGTAYKEYIHPQLQNNYYIKEAI